jgi:hypothetical protein
MRNAHVYDANYYNSQTKEKLWKVILILLSKILNQYLRI